MKLDNATIASCLRSAATALAVLFLIAWTEQVVSHPVHRSPPLKDPKTHQAVREMSQHVGAQRKELEEDTSIRLMPRPSADQNHMEICCLHANILNFYLNNILHKYSDEHPSMHQLKTDLHRVSEDLQDQGCMEGVRGINKAVGEIDILFTYLHDYCEAPKPFANATNDADNDN
ncbi:hypothetical protein GOODEAATRI_024279 [Goodea atripinnis]|uniref:Interleukin-22 n=1 Tax=Goodea atripinnis TaxID=208336 RepID=A0ABV0MUQ6_9TELE